MTDRDERYLWAIDDVLAGEIPGEGEAAPEILAAIRPLIDEEVAAARLEEREAVESHLLDLAEGELALAIAARENMDEADDRLHSHLEAAFRQAAAAIRNRDA